MRPRLTARSPLAAVALAVLYPARMVAYLTSPKSPPAQSPVALDPSSGAAGLSSLRRRA